MSVPVKGSVIIADGNGKVNVISPTSDNQVLCLDSAEPFGAKFTTIGHIMPSQKVKLTAPKRPSTNSNAYEVIMSMSVKGENTEQIQSIDIIGYKTGNASSYDVRIYDATNSLTIANANFTNTVSAVSPMGTLSNLPANAALFEIQAKRNGGNKKSDIYVEEVSIDYRST